MKKMKPDKALMQQMSRFAVFQRESVDVEKRTVEVAFSSEEPVERWFGEEVLSHAAGAVDLSRLNDGGAVLFNHGWSDQIGVIERAWIDADKRGLPWYVLATVRKRRKNSKTCKTASYAISASATAWKTWYWTIPMQTMRTTVTSLPAGCRMKSVL